MKIKLAKIIVGIGVLCLSACTEAGETTAVGAAAGGVLGAGLGAIVGNQVGSTGSGMVIGAMAGAGSGAAIGNVLEAQQEAIRTQDEAIERQEKMIRAQEAEIQELNRSGRDYPDYRTSALGRQLPAGKPARLTERSLSAEESGYLDTAAGQQARGSYRWDEERGVQVKTEPLEQKTVREETARLVMPDEASLTPQCRNAYEEINRITPATDKSEKLFHYRRALRLCPEVAAFHNGLGEVYLALNRREDAEFEFREALRLEPSYLPARENLNSLQQ